MDIANRLVQEIRKNYYTKSQKYQEKAVYVYVQYFTIRELYDALKKSHDTATGPDGIHHQLLKHLPRDSLMVLLDLFNDIWTSSEIPECWKETTVIHIPKPGKDSKNLSIIEPYL